MDECEKCICDNCAIGCMGASCPNKKLDCDSNLKLTECTNFIDWEDFE